MLWLLMVFTGRSSYHADTGMHTIFWILNRGSYWSAHVLLNLSNELEKTIKYVACQAFYRFFATSLIKIIQEYSYHIALKLLKTAFF